MTMLFTAPTKDQLRSAFQLQRGTYSMQFEAISHLAKSELATVLDKLATESNDANLHRLQGRAQVLKGILAFFDQGLKQGE